MAETTVQPTEIATNVLGYAEATADQGTITTVVDVTSCSSAVTVPTGGRRVKITGYIPKVTGSEINGANWTLSIKEGATVLNKATNHISVGTGSQFETMIAMWVGTPTAGAHTYKLTIEVSSGTGSIDNDATFPSFILVEVI